MASGAARELRLTILPPPKSHKFLIKYYEQINQPKKLT